MTQELTKSLILLDELLNSESKEELYQEILKYEVKLPRHEYRGFLTEP